MQNFYGITYVQLFQRCIALEKPKWNCKQPNRYGFDQDQINYASSVSQEDQTMYQEAITSNNQESWMVATTKEMESPYKNSVWELVSKPKDWMIANCKWVFRKMEDTHEDDAMRYEAWLVAKEYSQKEWVDYDEVLSPVVKYTHIEIMLSIGDKLDMVIYHVTLRLFYGDLDEVIICPNRKVFLKTGKENMVCRLKKCRYGLKQFPRQSYRHFTS